MKEVECTMFLKSPVVIAFIIIHYYSFCPAPQCHPRPRQEEDQKDSTQTLTGFEAQRLQRTKEVQQKEQRAGSERSGSESRSRSGGAGVSSEGRVVTVQPVDGNT